MQVMASQRWVHGFSDALPSCHSNGFSLRFPKYRDNSVVNTVPPIDRSIFIPIGVIRNDRIDGIFSNSPKHLVLGVSLLG